MLQRVAFTGVQVLGGLILLHERRARRTATRTKVAPAPVPPPEALYDFGAIFSQFFRNV